MTRYFVVYAAQENKHCDFDGQTCVISTLKIMIRNRFSDHNVERVPGANERYQVSVWEYTREV